MNQEIKAKWVAALRSGEYRQTKGNLRKSGAFCCLGVLCNLHAEAHPKIASKQESRHEYMGERMMLPYAVREWSGLPYDYGDEVEIKGKREPLTEHNDTGKRFLQIADAIEAQL